MSRSAVARWIESRLGGYVHPVNRVDESLPLRLEGDERRVAVVGAGLAGLCVACTLAERGFSVSVFEKEDYLGGKVGAWPVALRGGGQAFVEHGFHAFFRHYYNLNRFLRKLGITDSFRPIEDYRILTLDGAEYSFAGIANTPVLNILSMLRRKVFTLGEVLGNPRTMRLIALLQYHPERTFRRFDHVSFDDFARAVDLPDGLRLVFSSFARAFFASPRLMSFAELVKSFHFYFLGHDGGLIYDYPDDSYELSLLGPIEAQLAKHGARVHTGTPVESIGYQDGRFLVCGERFDRAILATDVVGTRRIADASPELTRPHPRLRRQLGGLRSGERYAVLRIWTDRAIERDLPGFVITDQLEVLDSVSIYERLEKSSAAWTQRHGGGIYELHSYAVPDHVPTDRIRDRFIEEFERYFPEMAGCRILDEHLQIRTDFTAFHTGLHAQRPEVETELPGLFLAGDWVKLPFPAMLMEAAASSGLLAANAILQAAGLRPEPLQSVPPLGLLTR
ncbi:MAG: FAD-dependent oxidoreductase [Deltaproteobacteria bacterium]|nr:FAD-dependent oxidoreductase [Deltaproteobacteria bacterium]